MNYVLWANLQQFSNLQFPWERFPNLSFGGFFGLPENVVVRSECHFFLVALKKQRRLANAFIKVLFTNERSLHVLQTLN